MTTAPTAAFVALALSSASLSAIDFDRLFSAASQASALETEVAVELAYISYMSRFNVEPDSADELLEARILELHDELDRQTIESAFSSVQRRAQQAAAYRPKQ